jgi:hypothetical protein
VGITKPASGVLAGQKKMHPSLQTYFTGAQNAAILGKKCSLE